MCTWLQCLQRPGEWWAVVRWHTGAANQTWVSTKVVCTHNCWANLMPSKSHIGPQTAEVENTESELLSATGAARVMGWGWGMRSNSQWEAGTLSTSFLKRIGVQEVIIYNDQTLSQWNSGVRVEYNQLYRYKCWPLVREQRTLSMSSWRKYYSGFITNYTRMMNYSFRRWLAVILIASNFFGSSWFSKSQTIDTEIGLKMRDCSTKMDFVTCISTKWTRTFFAYMHICICEYMNVKGQGVCIHTYLWGTWCVHTHTYMGDMSHPNTEGCEKFNTMKKPSEHMTSLP